MKRETNVPASGAVVQETTGQFAYLIFRNVSTACQFSFDGSTWRDATTNDNIGPIVPKPDRVYFQTVNGLSSVVDFEYSNVPLTAQSASQKVQATYLFCNGGNNGIGIFPIAKVGLANNWTLTAPAGSCNLAVSNAVYIPGTNNGHGRKSITFINSNKISAHPVVIFDSNGILFLYIDTNDTTPYTFETDADFYACGYLTPNQGLYYSEIYYSN